MAYNFMQMSHYLNTSFVVVMGNLDIKISDSESDNGTSASNLFQTFFPVLLLPFILKRFQFTDDFNHSLIEDGQEILNEERERLCRSTGAVSTANEAKLNDERDASASARRNTNSRGVQFNRNDESQESFEELETAPGSTKDIIGVGSRMKSGFMKLIGKGGDEYDDEKKREK
eukprot:CAMPEP_0117004320 /NCGR_PEP_ID=MMETSP0472-20121206/5336_1 /TAXON_ID=693140 ORGANISM="Tiarina fusus, Strain LIS" /NCGR_SAMPLE_ID=MMETSP0472 /ASSEMBLY_ACC=CAM_ASM_000603 /LENGTH=172 /DNA_ID=CAMNT_0004705243 /DNA_START=1254 /DNA_END=1769 /DNA_ORIENTATION=+